MSSSRRIVPLASGLCRWPLWSSLQKPAGWRGTRWFHGFLFLFVQDFHAPEQHGILAFPCQSGKTDDLIAHHVAVLGSCPNSVIEVEGF